MTEASVPIDQVIEKKQPAEPEVAKLSVPRPKPKELTPAEMASIKAERKERQSQIMPLTEANLHKRFNSIETELDIETVSIAMLE